MQWYEYLPAWLYNMATGKITQGQADDITTRVQDAQLTPAGKASINAADTLALANGFSANRGPQVNLFYLFAGVGLLLIVVFYFVFRRK